MIGQILKITRVGRRLKYTKNQYKGFFETKNCVIHQVELDA